VPNGLRCACVIVGNNLPGYSVFIDNFVPGNHGKFIYNNRLRRIDLTLATATTINGLPTVMQNMVELQTNGLTCCNIFADGDQSTVGWSYRNYNTAVGERASGPYNDVAGTNIAPAGMIKRVIDKNSVYANVNIKTDTFVSGGGGAGVWASSYGVGNVGRVSLFGAHQQTATDQPHNDNNDTPYMGNYWIPGSIPNAQFLGYTKAQIQAWFVNWTVAPAASPALGGNYKPLSTATPLHGLIPAGAQSLKYDLAGATRRDDGTGAVGAYES
jgi:hypothetical protein